MRELYSITPGLLLPIPFILLVDHEKANFKKI